MKEECMAGLAPTHQQIFIKITNPVQRYQDTIHKVNSTICQAMTDIIFKQALVMGQALKEAEQKIQEKDQQINRTAHKTTSEPKPSYPGTNTTASCSTKRGK